MEEQGEEVERGYKDGGVTPAEEQWGSADSDSGQYACFQDGTQLEVRLDWFTNCSLNASLL